MLYEQRTYTCRPGTLAQHVDLYAQLGYGPHSRHLGRPLLFATTEFGDVNSYVHIWTFESLQDRAARRAALWVDQEWLAYVARSRDAGWLVKQDTRLLQSCAFAHDSEIGISP